MTDSGAPDQEALEGVGPGAGKGGPSTLSGSQAMAFPGEGQAFLLCFICLFPFSKPLILPSAHSYLVAEKKLGGRRMQC